MLYKCMALVHDVQLKTRTLNCSFIVHIITFFSWRSIISLTDLMRGLLSTVFIRIETAPRIVAAPGAQQKK